MTETVRELLRMFDALPPSEQQEAVTEILRRQSSDEGVSDAALDELAAELFRSYDAEEASRTTP